MTNPLSTLAQDSARWSARHPWRAILGWLALVCVAVGLAAMVPTQNTTDADFRLGDSGRASAMVARGGLTAPDSEQVLVTGATAAARAGAARELAVDLRTTTGVTAVADPLASSDGSSYLVSVQLARDQDDADAVQAVTDRVQTAHPELRVRETGDLSLDAAVGQRVSDDLSSSETLSVPITLILMLLAFGALIAAGIPVLLAASSVVVTIGLLAPLSHLVHVDDTVSAMVVLIGMAVGVDYSLFFLKREREERARGASTRDAVEIAARTSGHSILVSGAAVVCAMAGLFVVGDATFDSLAVGSILVVAVAVLGSITVLPALLSRLGGWVDRPRVPFLHRWTSRMTRGAVSGRLLAPVTRHPLVAVLVAGMAVVLMALPALGMRTHGADLDTLPASIPAVQTARDLAAAYPSQGTTAELVVRAPAAQQGAVATALRTVAAGDLQVSADSRTTVLTTPIPHDESDPRTDAAVRALRSALAPALSSVPGASYAVGGDAAESLDFVQREQSRLPLVIGLVLLLTLVVMGVTFRSVPIALLSAVLNLGSVGVAFGLMTLVFQHGWFESWLDFSSPGFVIDWLPMVVMVILVGLSMDYHVFVVSRIREHVETGMPTRLAVRRGVADTAGVVTSAAAVMVSVFAIFATLSMMEMKMMGVGLAFAILVDATVFRLVLLPAALCLLGDRAWWPAGRPQVRGEVVEERDPAYV